MQKSLIFLFFFVAIIPAKIYSPKKVKVTCDKQIDNPTLINIPVPLSKLKNKKLTLPKLILDTLTQVEQYCRDSKGAMQDSTGQYIYLWNTCTDWGDGHVVGESKSNLIRFRNNQYDTIATFHGETKKGFATPLGVKVNNSGELELIILYESGYSFSVRVLLKDDQNTAFVCPLRTEVEGDVNHYIVTRNELLEFIIKEFGKVESNLDSLSEKEFDQLFPKDYKR